VDKEDRGLLDTEFLGPGLSFDVFYVIGVEMLESKEDGGLLLTYVGLNWGALLGLEVEKMYAVLEVLVGRWSCDQTGEDNGLLTGVRIGVRTPVPPEPNQRFSVAFSLHAEKLWLNDAYGEADLGLEGLAVGAGCVVSW
jgi:hypothetical protein